MLWRHISKLITLIKYEQLNPVPTYYSLMFLQEINMIKQVKGFFDPNDSLYR